MKAWRVSIKYRIGFARCLFLGVFLSLLFPLNVRAEVDYGKEIIMVSMGDSYSSGEGIPPFYGPEDIAEKVKDEDWLAHRSTLSWPGQLQLKGLAQEMKEYKIDLKNKERSQDNIGKWYFVASSGAVTDNIFYEKQNKPYDKKKLKKDNNPMPLQAEIFQNINVDEVDYITLTLGGNDVGFAKIVESCAVNVGYSEQNGMPNLLIKAWNDFYKGENPIREKLSNIYSELWKNIGEKGNIIVAGYPQLIDPEGGKVLYGLFGYEFDKTDAKLLNKNVSAFNDAIERVVLDIQKNEGVNIYFVSVEDAFIGHGAYADEPYINKVVVPSKDEDLKKDKTSAYSMHPNETGARKYAGCVQETIDWIEAGKLPITVSGQVIDKNDQPVGDLTVVIETEKAKKEVFRGMTNESGEFSGDIKLTKQPLRIIVSNEEGFLIDTSVTKPIEYGNNDIGKIKLDNYEGTMVVEINDQESIDKDAINALYEQTIADYDKMMHEGQLSYREKNRDTYEEADRYTYYTIVDIDGNGVDELILRFDPEWYENHVTNKDSGYGESTYVYTVKDGKVVNVLVPEVSFQGFAPDIAHLGFTKIYKGTNLINRGYEHLPMDDAFYSYQDGVLSETPVVELTRGGGTWFINGEATTEEECEETYNRLSNGDEGYELQLYERPTKTEEQPGSKEDLIEEYKNFIKSQNDGSEYTNYLIYDIDKDGYPEVMIERMHTDERRSAYDLYTYESGRFSFVGEIDSLYPHGPGEYASYPNGNGMVSSCTFRQLESVQIITLNNGNIEIEDVYDRNVGYSADWQYYRDKFDQIYQDSQGYKAYINHQYYQSDASCPYYEGSYLLAQSAMDNFTAVYEAFEVDEETVVPPEKNDKIFMGISILDIGAESNIVANGNTYRIRYESTGKSDEYVGLNLYVNNSAESYRLDAVYYPSIEYVYVTDIDISDSYCNIAVVIGGEDDESSTYLFAFNDNEIRMITEFVGRLVPESINGDGTVLLEYGIGMGIRDYGSFRVRPEISVYDLSAEQVNLYSGRRVYSETGSTYEDEFRASLSSDLTVYAEPECITAAGVISAGNSVICEYAEYVRFDGSFYVTGEEISGYVTSSMLRSSCDNMFFVG